MDGIEPTTSRSAVECSTTELHTLQHFPEILFLHQRFFSKSKTKEWNVQVILVLKTNNLDFHLNPVTHNNADSLMNAVFFF